MRSVCAPGCVVEKYRPVRSYRLHVTDVFERSVGDIDAEVIPLFGRRRLFDGVVVVDEIGIPLIGLGAEKAVEPLESAADRPIPFRGSKIHLVFCAQMPFADHRGAESLLDQNLGERGTFGRDVTVPAGKTDRALADAGHAVGRVVSPGEQTRSRRGAQRCGVPLPVPQSVARDAVDVRRLDRSPVATQGAESDVVENDVENVRRAGGSLRLLVRAPVGNRIANIEVDDAFECVGHDLAPCR